MSLWVDFGVDSDLLSGEAARLGVRVRPASHYCLLQRPSTCLRLGFASSNEEEIREGTSRLLEAMAKCRRRADGT